jgi:hypothetical protein
MLADSTHGGTGPLIPRGKSCGMHRERLLAIIQQKELPLDLDNSGGEDVILLVEPDEDWLDGTAADEVLREYWGLLYHARVHMVMRTRLASRPVGEVRSRIERIGRAAFNDARFVLQRERLLWPGTGDAEAYARFAAVFLEMASFAPALLPRFFAAVDDPGRIAEVFASDVDADALLKRTQPSGASGPLPPARFAEDVAEEPAAEEADAPPDRTERPALQRQAEKAASRGNDVHAAILHQRARQRRDRGPRLWEVRRNPHFVRFVKRLAVALQLANEVDWAGALAPVLARAGEGWRNAESRLLYDLQKVCTDCEREIYTLDALGWLFTLGRQPLRRPVPAQRMVLTCKHLRSAMGRLGRCHLEPPQRQALDGLLRAAVHGSEGRLREQLRPPIGEALDRSGLVPRHTVEQVAREKVIEEFLDGIVRQGFARMGDLRDTLSRNQLKLHDLAGAGALVGSDQLLQVDRHLSAPLEGVYHAGEAYLRFFQRISSLLFATPAGRIFTYHVLIPFGGAFLLLEVLGHTIGKLSSKLWGIDIPFNHLSFDLVVGLFLLGMVNVPALRAGVLQAARWLGKGLRRVFVDWPGWLKCRRFVQAILESRWWRSLMRYVFKPLVVTALAWCGLLGDVSSAAMVPVLLCIYAAAAIALNSRAFRVAMHVFAHFTIVFWTRLISDFFTGLFRVVMRAFHVLLERLERTLYTVDEWFRFRSGQGRALLVTKALLGAVWGLAAYCLRFCVTLLAEPQINPIKHFPVVTVSHKIILPTQPLMASALMSVGLGKVTANTYATSIVFVIPGVFGFLAWELKENWRLYGANRPRTLQPVRMGYHGETLAQLLRPGFHSGTVPRTFARLRHAAGRKGEGPNGVALRRQSGALAHVHEAVSRFLRRELAGLLNRHPAWSVTPIHVGDVDLAATRIRVTLECPLRGEPARLAFEQHDGWIVAGIDEPGWMVCVSPAEAPMLGLALLGLYQIAGVDLVREQVDALFAPLTVQWTIRGTDLVVWTGLRFGAEVRYSLREEPRSAGSEVREPVAALAAQAVPELLLGRSRLAWDHWSRLWDGPAEAWDDDLVALARASVSVLPRAAGQRSQVAAEANRSGFVQQ